MPTNAPRMANEQGGKSSRILGRLPPAVVAEWDWQESAACRGRADVFFSPEAERGQDRMRRLAQAKQICGSCPVQTECRTHALAVGEPYGVWGGLSEAERGIGKSHRP